MMSCKKTAWESVILRTREVVIKQGFDDVCGEIDVNTVVFLPTRHFSDEKVNGLKETQNDGAYTAFSGSIQSTSIKPSWSGLTIV